MKTFVYIDGFNLYFGALRRTPYKWLDVDALCRLVLKRERIEKIRYFTARVAARAHDPDLPLRQQMYLRALGTLPNVEVCFGHFLTHPVTMPVCDAAGLLTGAFATVLKTEEKGSDVNLASYLLLDAFEDRFDQAVVITNDSDLLKPIEIVRRILGKRVGILNPHARTSQVLAREADFVRQIRGGALGQSQFPDRMRDRSGHFHKPPLW